jgi:hypothetical protein
MKKAKSLHRDDLRPEYAPCDLKHGVRGKYLKQFQAGTNLVRLSPDVAAAFPTDDAVNDALRSLLRVTKAASRRPVPRQAARKRAVA